MRAAAPWLTVLAFAVCGVVHAADDGPTPEKRAEIRRLIAATGGPLAVSAVADAATRDLAVRLKKSKPDIPDRVFATINRELVKLLEAQVNVPGGLADRLVALYHRNFTHEEITQLIAFYQTPFGRKTIDTLPKLTSEAMSATNVWVRALAPEIRKRVDAALKQEGIEMPRGKK